MTIPTVVDTGRSISEGEEVADLGDDKRAIRIQVAGVSVLTYDRARARLFAIAEAILEVLNDETAMPGGGKTEPVDTAS